MCDATQEREEEKDRPLADQADFKHPRQTQSRWAGQSPRPEYAHVSRFGMLCLPSQVESRDQHHSQCREANNAPCSERF